MRDNLLAVAEKTARAMADLPSVMGAIAGGSLGRGGTIDAESDADICMWIRGNAPDAPLVARVWETLGARALGAGDYELDGWEVELSFQAFDEAAKSIARLIDREEPDADDSTAHWMAYSVILWDPTGEVAHLRDQLKRYPNSLRTRLLNRACAAMSKPVRQAPVLARRGDLPAFWMAVSDFSRWFAEALFALNRLWSPGPKRFLDTHLERCKNQPTNTRERLTQILALGEGISMEERAEEVERLASELNELVKK